MKASGFGSKSVASQASSALAHLGKGGKPLRFEGREKYADHVRSLDRAYAKGSPFVNGALTFPRPDPSRPGRFMEEDMRYALIYIDPTAASESISRPLMAVRDADSEEAGVTILSATLRGSGTDGGSGIRVNRGFLAAYRLAKAWEEEGGPREPLTNETVEGWGRAEQQVQETPSAKPTATPDDTEKERNEWQRFRAELSQIEAELESTQEMHGVHVVSLATARRAVQRSKKAQAPYRSALTIVQEDIVDEETTTEP